MRHRRQRPHQAFTWLRSHAPVRTVRARLTLLYGSLFLASGTVLLVIVGLLWGNATDGTFLLSSPVPTNIFHLSALGPPPAGLVTQHGHLVPVVPIGGAGSFAAKKQQVFGQLHSLAVQQHAHDFHQLLLYSAVALAIMAMLSIGLGWLIAGRVLRPLRTITVATRDISASNLHARLDLHGPEDELKELGDTIDDLLERLERSFQSQQQFVANASHELRTRSPRCARRSTSPWPSPSLRRPQRSSWPSVYATSWTKSIDSSRASWISPALKQCQPTRHLRSR